MDTIIAGSRHILELHWVRQGIRDCGWEITKIISGGASGVDESAILVANLDGFERDIYMADWDKYDNMAGPIRNREMDAVAEALIAVWDGVSTGTKDMIGLMSDRPTHVVRVD